MTALRTFLAVLLSTQFLAAACGGAGVKPGNLDTSPSPSSVGTYEDARGFRSFASRIDSALGGGDLQFFLDNVSFGDVSCASESPRPPAACDQAAEGSTVQGILAAVWDSEDSYLDPAAYESLLTDFLSEASAGESDEFGPPEARLYAYAVIQPELAYAPPALETVQAILTRIAPASPPQREALLLTLSFDGERWAITQLVMGPATFLDPHGPLVPPQSGFETIFKFWAPWEPGAGE